LRPRARDALLLTLTAAAGSADAVSYLGLGRVFTANMTGNLVLLGIAIGQAQLVGAVRSVTAFAAFILGVLVGVRVTAKTEPATTWPRSVTVVLLGELGLLVVLFAGWEIATGRPGPLALNIMIALSAASMGMQTAAARRLGVEAVTTTFVTGMLTGLIAELAGVRPGRSHWTLWAATLACMVIGAAAGAAAFLAWRPGAPLVASLLVATVIAAATWLRRAGDQGNRGVA
jgi:uncharacterized membrane protein YoaK (UPF0700 family)